MEVMSSEEFEGHLEDYRRSPWGPERFDLALGQLTAILANVYSKKGSSNSEPKDFVIGEDIEDMRKRKDDRASFFDRLVKD